MSFAAWNAEAGRLLTIDRAHRVARKGVLRGRQLLRVGRVSRFLTVCLAIALGSMLLLSVDGDVPISRIVIAGIMLTMSAPFAGAWLDCTDFERLHAPPAGLLLFRLRRLLPLLLLIGIAWAAMLGMRSDNVWAIVAIGAMPIVMSLANMLRRARVAFALRAAITATFVGGWIGWLEWLPVVTVALQFAVAVWFVRDLAAYDRDGFAADDEDVDHLTELRDRIATQRELPDVRASRRRSLIGSAWQMNWAAQRDLPSLWQHRPLAVTVTNLVVVALWLAPIWLGVIGVWRAVDGVPLLWCVLSPLLSMSLLQHEHDEQLYLWGVDMREVERHNVIARLATVALPAVAAAAVAGLLLGGSDVRWTAVLLLAGLHLARIGISAFNGGTRLVLVIAFAIGLLVAGAGASLDPASARVVAGVAAGFGLLGAAVRLSRTEHGLREHAFA